jgi:anaerobic carbon-monoxide dehydrogenase iron sulfur subunit
MRRKIAVVPEKCSGCRVCEMACAIHRQRINNPKKARIRVTTIYPHPVVRMPVVCNQCKDAKCMSACPADAIYRQNGVVRIRHDDCMGCHACVEACPFGAMYIHPDIDVPLKCDLCEDSGRPQCVKMCPTGAIVFMPEHVFGQAHRLNNVLSYTHMKEIEYMEHGKPKRLHYADNNAAEGRDKTGDKR